MSLLSRLRRLFSTRKPSRDVAGNETAQGDFEDEDADDSHIDPFNPFPDPVPLEITDVLDLHAFAPRDVRRVVEEYLLEARARGFRSVRIIHGKGVGMQRETVRSVLKKTPFVEHFSDAPAEAGGWGATVVRFTN